MYDFDKELAFLSLAENLKKELRHSWLSNGRRESVAEHCWRLSLMALRYAGQLHTKVDVDRCIKIALVHDLAEAIAGDIPIFHAQTAEAKKAKFLAEYAGMKEIQALLSDPNGDELYQWWDEYELQKTDESRFIKALDKLEAFIQHNESELHTWEEREKRMLFQNKWLKKYCAWDPFLDAFSTAVIEMALRRLEAAGEDLVRIKQEALEEELKWASCPEMA